MTYTRRRFIKTTGFISLLPLLGSSVLDSSLSFTKHKITSIELFRFDIDIPRYFSFGTWYNRQHVFMKMTSGEYAGWAEVPASVNNPKLDLKVWGEFLKELKGKDLNECLQLFQSKHAGDNKWSWKKLEFAEMSVFDLMGRIQSKPSVEMLGFNGKEPVHGIFCILEKDPIKVKERAHEAIEQGLDKYVKVKLFGTKDLDIEIVKAAKDVIGPKSFLIGDANEGYKDWKSIEDLADTLKLLNSNGLYGLEDPAALKVNQWIELQQKVGQLNLIPDAIIRPAWEALGRVRFGMGHIFNLHPSAMGSFSHMAKLYQTIKGYNAGIMIGDDSLVGPACTAWQQIAIGMNASWVEALEKKEDSAAYLPCIKSKATYINMDGKFAFDPKPGFGLELDTSKLKDASKAYLKI